MFGLSWNRYTFGLVLVSLFLAYLSAYEALQRIAPIIAYLLGGFLVALIIVGGLTFLCGGFFYGFNVVKTRVIELQSHQIIFQANAIAAEAEAQQKRIMVIEAPKDRQIFIRDEDPHSVYRPAHLSPTYVNGHAVAALPEQVSLYREFHADSSRSLPPGNDQSMIIEAPLPQKALLPAICDADNILVVGGKGTGKTTLLQWIEAAKIEAGQQITIMDSHAAPSQWSGRVIGFNRDYQEILREMVAELRELDRRYKMRAKGDESYLPRTCIIDEFTLLPRTLRDHHDFEVRDYSVSLLTEGRKVKMNCVWGIHSDRVGPMGLEGAGDIRECFDVVVYLKNVKGERFAVVDFGDGKEDIRYTLPGPFIGPKQPPKRPIPTPEEKRILIAWWEMKGEPGFSGSKLHRVVTGQTSNPNAKQLQNLRDLITKFGENPGF
jgi:hypothetical protein